MSRYVVAHNKLGLVAIKLPKIHYNQKSTIRQTHKEEKNRDIAVHWIEWFLVFDIPPRGIINLFYGVNENQK